MRPWPKNTNTGAILADGCCWAESSCSAPTDITLDCTIRDLTDKGARVRILSPVILPDEVWLIELRNGLAFECRVAWKRVPEFGLAFVSVHDLAATERPDLRMMKRIWVENSAR